LREQDKSDRLFAKKDRRKLSKNLTFQHHGILYQVETCTPNRLRHAYVEVSWGIGLSVEVEYNSKPLKYSVWSEKVYEQPKVMDIKELEAMWPKPTSRRPKMRHPWR